MKHWRVVITDGNDMRHCWNVTGKSRYDVLCCVLETMNEESYGMPTGITLDGIKKIDVYPVDMTYTVWG